MTQTKHEHSGCIPFAYYEDLSGISRGFRCCEFGSGICVKLMHKHEGSIVSVLVNTHLDWVGSDVICSRPSQFILSKPNV